MEYDVVAEKIYTLPSREELEQLSPKGDTSIIALTLVLEK